jgi:predicted porin
MMTNHIKTSLLLTTLLAAAGADAAESSVILYGRLDTGVRYSTNQTKTGGSLTEVMNGATSPSRWGVRGMEELGDGMKALFVLEGGINPDVGTATQSGRLFGRTATVGLSGDFGVVTIGRQVSPLYETVPLNEPFGWANLYEGGFFYDNYASKRWDNAVKYAYKTGPVAVSAMVSAGEVAGNARAGRNAGATFGYTAGQFAAAGAYQVTHDAKGVVDNKAFTLGGSYSIDAYKLFLNYLGHRTDTSAQKNDVWLTGLTYAATPAIDLVGSYYYDRQRNVDGNKKLAAAMVNYKLSKRTNVYLQADRAKITQGYASNTYDIYVYPTGILSRSTVTAGIRHMF